MAFIKRIFDKIRLTFFLSAVNGIETHLTDSEKVFLYQISKKTAALTILEVGSYKGASAVCFATGSPKQAKIYCIDTWDNRSMSEGQYDTFQIFQDNVSQFSYKIISIRGDSNDSIKSLQHLSLDILFLDGDHSYDAVLNDYKNYFPLLKSGGFLLMHDAGWAEGVQTVIKEHALSQTHEHTFFPNLFVARKK